MGRLTTTSPFILNSQGGKNLRSIVLHNRVKPASYNVQFLHVMQKGPKLQTTDPLLTSMFRTRVDMEERCMEAKLLEQQDFNHFLRSPLFSIHKTTQKVTQQQQSMPLLCKCILAENIKTFMHLPVLLKVIKSSSL